MKVHFHFRSKVYSTILYYVPYFFYQEKFESEDIKAVTMDKNEAFKKFKGKYLDSDSTGTVLVRTFRLTCKDYITLYCMTTLIVKPPEARGSDILSRNSWPISRVVPMVTV